MGGKDMASEPEVILAFNCLANAFSWLTAFVLSHTARGRKKNTQHEHSGFREGVAHQIWGD